MILIKYSIMYTMQIKLKHAIIIINSLNRYKINTFDIFFLNDKHCLEKNEKNSSVQFLLLNMRKTINSLKNIRQFSSFSLTEMSLSIGIHSNIDNFIFWIVVYISFCANKSTSKFPFDWYKVASTLLVSEELKNIYMKFWCISVNI